MHTIHQTAPQHSNRRSDFMINAMHIRQLSILIVTVLAVGCSSKKEPVATQSKPGSNTSERRKQTNQCKTPTSVTAPAACTPNPALPSTQPVSSKPSTGKQMKKSSGQYVDGKKDGQWMYWDDMGNRHRKAHYKRGLKHGRWVAWNTKGVTTQSGRYKENRKHGQWMYKDKNKMRIVHYNSGRKIREAKYVNKRLKRERCWSETSTRIRCA